MTNMYHFVLYTHDSEADKLDQQVSLTIDTIFTRGNAFSDRQIKVYIQHLHMRN